jgi:hypothetical protein
MPLKNSISGIEPKFVGSWTRQTKSDLGGSLNRHRSHPRWRQAG